MPIKSSIVIMPIVSPWYTCFESFETCPLSFILHEIWALCHVTHRTCVCVCVSICVQPAKPSKLMHLCGAYSFSFIQLRKSKCTRLEGQRRCSLCHFHSSRLKSSWQGHKFLCHETCREHICDVRFQAWSLKGHRRASFSRAMNVGNVPRTSAVVASKPGHSQQGRKPRP